MPILLNGKYRTKNGMGVQITKIDGTVAIGNAFLEHCVFDMRWWVSDGTYVIPNPESMGDVAIIAGFNWSDYDLEELSPSVNGKVDASK